MQLVKVIYSEVDEDGRTRSHRSGLKMDFVLEDNSPEDFNTKEKVRLEEIIHETYKKSLVNPPRIRVEAVNVMRKGIYWCALPQDGEGTYFVGEPV
jgi:hypothetical protein